MADETSSITQLASRLGAERPRAAAKPERTPMQWGNLEGKEPPQRQWSIDHWLTNAPTLLAGPGGIGKTLLAQTIATALAVGKRFIDHIAEPHVVLFWACEDDHDEIWRRQCAINRYFGITLADLDRKLIIEPRLGRENSLFVTSYGQPAWTPLRDELSEQIGDYHADTLFLDNIGQTFGGSENDRHHVTAYVNGIAGLIKTPVLMGHPAKMAGSEFSGSTAWENAVRMRWFMGMKLPDQAAEEGGEEPDENVRYLAKRKVNYTTRDYRKLTYIDGVFRTEIEAGEFTLRYTFAQRQEVAEETVLTGIAALAERGVHGRLSPTSPDYLPKKMRQMNLAAGFGHKDICAALNRLFMAQKIREVEVGKLANRMPRMGVVRS
jgi:RecA-family ATPase